MRRFLAIIIALALAALPARADFGAGNNLMGFWVGGQAPAVATFVSADSSTSNLTTYSFTSQAFGTASADRYLVTAVFNRNNSRTVNSVTIGGVSATALFYPASAQPNSGQMSFWIAAVPTGTSGTVEFTLSAGDIQAGHITWAVTGLLSTTPTDTAEDETDPLSQSIDVLAGGVVIGAMMTADNGTTTTWSGITEDVEEQSTEFIHISGASDEFAAAATPTVVATPVDFLLAGLMVVALR